MEFTVKVSILGNYGHNNLGDEAILYGLVSLLDGMCEMVVFTESIERSKRQKYSSEKVNLLYFREQFAGRIYRLPHIIFDMFKKILNTDVLIIGGGGLLNSSHPRSTIYYGLVALLSRIARKKTIALGISVGPLDTRYSKVFAWIFFALCNEAYLRDEASFQFVKRLKICDCQLVPDLALAYKNNDKIVKYNRIALNVIPYFETDLWFEHNSAKAENYKHLISNIIDYLLETTDCEIALFSVDTRVDARSVDYFKSQHLENDRITAFYPTTVDELKDIIASAKIMIGSRLHATVLAEAACTPFLALGYQEKVMNFSEDQQNKFAIHLERSDTKQAITLISQLFNNINSEQDRCKLNRLGLDEQFAAFQENLKSVLR